MSRLKPSKNLTALFMVGIDILSTRIAATTKKILASIGDVGASPGDGSDGDQGPGLTESDNVEWWQHVGFASRPVKSVPGKSAANAIIIRRGNNDAAIASQDTRGLSVYGNLKEGETCVYAGGADGNGQARTIWKADGSVTLYTTKGNAPGGTGMMIGLDAANGACRMVNDLGFAVIVDKSGITLTTGKAGLKLGADGSISIVGTGQTQIDGTSIMLGSVGVPGVNSVCVGVTGIAAAASTKVVCQL